VSDPVASDHAASDQVAVVTDSTACLPEYLSTQWGVRVVQMQLSCDNRIDDENRFDRTELVTSLRSGKPASTSPPEAGAFFWAYQEAVDAGADYIISMHISSQMSETVSAAKEAASQTKVPVYVLDSATTGMSLGFAALSAARAAAAGAQLRRVITTAQRRYETSTELIYVDTMDYLRRGGRIGAAKAIVGTALSLKPVLTVKEGEVSPLAKTAGSRRALTKIVDLAVEYSGERDVDIAITTFGADEQQIGEVAAELRARVPLLHEALVVEASAVIGVHVGPGAMAVTISPT
jgi:DegV family protein with EDD domain